MQEASTQDEATPAVPPTPPPQAVPTPVPVTSLRMHTRVRHGMKRPHNWMQLVKFCAVGGSGYVVNLVVFAFCVGIVDLHHLIAATVAFVVAVNNNFWWNRHWTFGATDRHAGFQAARFFAVSIIAFLFAASVLEVLVRLDVPEILAQAISIVAATPLNFIGNKMWSFGRSVPLR
jgi:putative flippase GtrA